MAANSFLAYFYEENAAHAASEYLHNMIFVVSTKKYETEIPDPDISVSALMVGMLPNLAHGIYGTNEAVQNGSYLLIIVDEEGHDREVEGVVQHFGGSIVKKER